MSVLRVGSSNKYADGWALAFGKAAKTGGKKAKAAPKKAAAAKKKAAKPAGRKAAKKKR